jgi:predicted GTPase
LVIGKTGVGKSSVINVAFGIKTANVSEFKAGVSDINTEIISGDNDQFVLHDSQGFEPGEDDNLEIVKNFIQSRSAMPDIKDNIHAIWLCFGIPRAGGRILETGIEQLLQLETQTPIIAVFTKYDLLVSRLKKDMKGSATLAEDAKKEADAIVKKACTEPLEKAAGKAVPNVTVSTLKGYEYTLSI